MNYPRPVPDPAADAPEEHAALASTVEEIDETLAVAAAVASATAA